MNVLEFNTDNCVLSNGTYVASFRLLVETGIAPDTERTWHYYGTLVPGASINGVPAIQHDAVTVLLDTPDLVSAALFMAKDIAVAALPPTA